jgi:magnesium chelatase ATPase subunit I
VIEEDSFDKLTFPFLRFVGQDQLKLALCLVMVDPNVGGVLIMGDRGTGKSIIVRSLVHVLPDLEVVPGDPFNSSPSDPSLMSSDILARFRAGEKLASTKRATPLVELPLGATEDRVCGTIDIEKALQDGVKALEPGLLARVNRGILYIDEVNLLDDGLVDIILDSAASGINTVEREGISFVHPAKFIMIGSGDPEEGEMRPQMLDRFGLAVNVSTLCDADARTQLVINRMSYEANPKAYVAETAQETATLRQNLMVARQRLKNITMPREIQLKISDLCARLGVDGLRGDIVTNRAAKALVALEGRKDIAVDDIEQLIAMTLVHRLRKDPLDTMNNVTKVTAMWSRVKTSLAFEKQMDKNSEMEDQV